MAHVDTTASRMRQASFYSFIIFLSISALLAIASVLSGEFGEFEIKVLISTSVIALASICSLCCSAYSSGSRNPVPGLGGITLAAVSATMLILGVWAELDSEGYWKLAAVLSIFAIAFAHSLALLTVRLRPAHRWLQTGTAINIFTLATIFSFMILGEVGNDSLLKFVAVLAILAALATLVIPILGRLAKIQPSQSTRSLTLIQRRDGLYEDSAGRLYQVKAMSDPSSE